MKRSLIKLYLFNSFIIFSLSVIAQSDSLKIDSLKKVLATEKEDTNKVNTLLAIAESAYRPNQGDILAIHFADEALLLSEKINYVAGELKAHLILGDFYRATNLNLTLSRKHLFSAIAIAKALNDQSEIAELYMRIGFTYSSEDNYPEWLQNIYIALRLYENIQNKKGKANCYSSIGAYYFAQHYPAESITNYQKALILYSDLKDSNAIADTYQNMGAMYLEEGNYPEAIAKDSAALKILQKTNFTSEIVSTLENIGNVFENQGSNFLAAGDATTAHNKFAEALKNYQPALNWYIRTGQNKFIVYSKLEIGNLYIKLKNNPQAKIYLESALQLAKQTRSPDALKESYYALMKLDTAENNFKEAFNNFRSYSFYKDSLSNNDAIKKETSIKMQYEFDKKESIAKAEQDKKDADAKRSKNQQYLVIASLGILVLAVLIIALIQVRNNRQKQKANLLLERQKQKVETTLTELKSTQAQLIQSEKMASLGELTAGIAHEIQNPLNFVNNFSEVNKELIEELQEERNKPQGTRDEKLESEILNDIKENEQKINHHGKRADAIVKGMLQHSRSSVGVKELTDINALADEYLRLSYHGLRAKDKSFNAEMKIDFDKSIGKINIVPQDIGRVLLNLYNNAFYAVNEKIKTNAENYQPIVSVQTKKLNDKILLTVMDNGNGIPQKVIDKIFQPFFTTKPTGQGTGLGLSLSYDIIKAHGGEIKVQTKEGEGSEFEIRIPIV